MRKFQTLTHLGSRASSGYVPDDVIELIAEKGYDPQWGVRDLGREANEAFLYPLTALDPGDHRTRIVAGEILLEER